VSVPAANEQIELPPLPPSRESYSHEVISFGFWAGDKKVREPMYYSYTAPEPPGLRPSGSVRCTRPARRWVGERSAMAQLPYESARSAADPRAALLGFLESAYCAGADLGDWDREDLKSSWCPDLPALSQLLREAD
jgi:hypothetical protein